MTDAAATVSPTAGPDADRSRIHLGWAVAGLSAAAGVIHFAMVPSHSENLTDALGFALVGWFQLIVAGIILAGRDDKRLYQIAVAGNLAVLGLWVWSRTSGLPFGAHAGEAEDVTVVDGTAAVLQILLVVISLRIILANGRVAVGRLMPAFAAVAALGLATTVITSSEAADHGGSGHAHGDPAAAADHHDETGGHASYMAQIDADRCDRQFNHESYWEEAEYLGVDIYQGGAMAASDHGDDHGAGTATTTTDPDPLGGRGSEGLDELISLTDQAGGGEVAAARLVTGLGEASDADYEAWKWWLRGSGHIGGGHEGGHNAAAPDDSGHGSHAGPQAWTAMTDPEQCAQLAEELERARETALRYPTAQDATDAGWFKVTPYLPGIAAHYIKGSNVADGKFIIEQPEMILYDGNGPDARVVGLSYYMIHEGDSEPSQGFTGANDHSHRHIGLCIGAGGVIGDSTTTAEECEERGGRKQESGNGWMSHAWVVPGCESPWGVFSGASPILDGELDDESGENDGGCSASGVRERYGMGTPTEAEPASTGGG